jgi:hypothetical protein
MTQRVTWRPAAVAALLLAAAAAEAGIQKRHRVGWLGVGDWQLREGAGQAYLVESPYVQPVVKNDRVTGSGNSHRWEVSAPTITAGSGQPLGYATKGREPSVRMVSGKGEEGASTRWAFEIVSRIRPEGVCCKNGDGGITFRVMAAEGPFKGWYLAAEGLPTEGKAGKDSAPDKRRLELVRGERDATVFTYVETFYFYVPR